LIVPLIDIYDNLAGTAGAVSPNDGYIRSGDIILNVGPTFTVLPQTWIFEPAPNFNTPPSTFTAQVIVVGSDASAMSNPITVPEPSTALVGAMGALALLRRRRK
jgi:hypothetical protein